MSRLPDRRYTFSEHCNTALYPPLLYIGPVIGSFIGSLVGIPVLGWLYIGRLLNAAIGGCVTYFAIRSAPRKQALLLLVGSLPVVLFEEASVSADSLLIAAFIGFTALLMRISSGQRQSRTEMAITAAVTGIITVGKVAYAPLAVLPPCFVLMRDRRFSRQAVLYSIFSLVAICLWFCWAVLIHRMVFSMRPGIVVDPHAQLLNMVRHPGFATGVFCRTIGGQAVPLLVEAVGHSLGYATIWVKGYVVLVLLITLFVAGLTRNERSRLRTSTGYFMVAAALCACCGLVILLLLYLQFNPVGAPYVEGAQGRYFLPLICLSLALAPTMRVPAIASQPGRMATHVYYVGVASISAVMTLALVLHRYWF